jgi:hypothetical protein
MTITEEIKARRHAWAEALRSGRFKRGRGALHVVDRHNNQDEFCCLGVACEVAIAEGINVSRNEAVSQAGHVVYQYGNPGETPDNRAFPPEAVAEFFGLHNAKGAVVRQDNGEKTTYLSWLNDEGSLTFDEIADIIDGTHHTYKLGD